MVRDLPMFSQFLILAKANLRAFRSRSRHNLRESKLLLGTLGLFLLGYLIIGYFMFSTGLRYLYGLPGVGLLLVERVLYMLYFFFFVMLTFSNAVLLYGGLFRGKETSWLLTLPLNQNSIFCWKVMESLIVSSWGLLILSAPMLLAFGEVFKAPLGYYFKSILVFIPYLLLPAAVAGGIVVVMVRWWGRFGKWVLWGFGLWVLYRGVESFAFVRHLAVNTEQTSTSASVAIRQVLGRTELAVHPLLPSTWMSEMLLHWARGYAGRGLFYSLLLLSYTLLGVWLCVEVFSRFTYRCWNVSQANRAAKTRRKGRRAGIEAPGDVCLKWNPWQMLGVGRVNAALLQKDAREYIRDATQWIPSAVLFGLLFLYSFNLKHFTADPNDPFWVGLISFLNFGVSCLAVSTLCTRFIFPLFSLEGRRLWIVGLAPFPLTRVFWIKLVLFAGSIAILTSTLMLISGTRLQLPLPTIFRFVAGICMVSLGLTSLSLGLGVLFPNLNEANPSKIVSGFGGTLCLILNFLFILVFLMLFATPAVLKMRPSGTDFEKISGVLTVFCSVGIIVVTALTTVLPIFLSLRKIKRLELLGKL